VTNVGQNEKDRQGL